MDVRQVQGCIVQHKEYNQYFVITVTFKIICFSEKKRKKCISLIRGVEHLFMSLLIICMSVFGKMSVHSSDRVLIGFFGFFAVELYGFLIYFGY